MTQEETTSEWEGKASEINTALMQCLDGSLERECLGESEPSKSHTFLEMDQGREQKTSSVSFGTQEQLKNLKCR